jgi:hypothetical protein
MQENERACNLGLDISEGAKCWTELFTQCALIVLLEGRA